MVAQMPYDRMETKTPLIIGKEISYGCTYYHQRIACRRTAGTYSWHSGLGRPSSRLHPYPRVPWFYRGPLALDSRRFDADTQRRHGTGHRRDRARPDCACAGTIAAADPTGAQSRALGRTGHT